MYVPPFAAVCRRLNINPAALERNDLVRLPGKFLHLLLQLSVVACDFDEDDYLRKNPDVQKAFSEGKIESGLLHFAGFGYFENREGGSENVDEEWYLRSNSDVAQAVKSGEIASGKYHYYNIGGAEGRAPNANCERDARGWRAALRTDGRT